MKLSIFTTLLLSMATSAAASPKISLHDLSRNDDFVIAFDSAQYHSFRSGSLHDSKNELTLSVRCYESTIEKTYALQMTDRKGEQLVLSISPGKCYTFLEEVIREGRISSKNPFLTIWTGASQIDDIRLTEIQLGDQHLNIQSTPFDPSTNELLENLAVSQERASRLHRGPRTLYVPSTYRAQGPSKNDALYVRVSNDRFRVRTENIDVRTCRKRPADTMERFFKHLLGDQCYYF